MMEIASFDLSSLNNFISVCCFHQRTETPVGLLLDAHRYSLFFETLISTLLIFFFFFTLTSVVFSVARVFLVMVCWPHGKSFVTIK